MDTHAPTMPVTHGSHRLPAAAALGALGVVYGDIGTSPLYALKEPPRQRASAVRRR